jgi:hypothetical protein
VSSRFWIAWACALIALLIGVPAASAATRVAVATGGSTTSDCIAPNPPCTLQRAAEGTVNGGVAQDGDVVIVSPGTYNESSALTISNAALIVKGVSGQPRPRIFNTSSFGMRVTAVGNLVRYLQISGATQGLRFEAGSDADQVIASGDGTGADTGCQVINAPTDVHISNSICRGGQGGVGLDFETMAATVSAGVTLRNVTVVTPGTGLNEIGIRVSAQANSTLTLDAKNVIADSSTDVFAGAMLGSSAAANLSFSNFATVAHAGGTVTDPTTNNNQMTTPVYADVDLHEAASSPTIDAGTADPLFSIFGLDVDGDPRTVGSAPDIGADEFIPGPPPAPPGPPAPEVPSNAFTVLGVKGKKLSLSVASAGIAEVSDGASATGVRAIIAARRLLKPSSAAGGPGTTIIRLRLTKTAMAKLRRKGRLNVKARITFTPTGGIANSQIVPLRIRGK